MLSSVLGLSLGFGFVWGFFLVSVSDSFSFLSESGIQNRIHLDMGIIRILSRALKSWYCRPLIFTPRNCGSEVSSSGTTCIIVLRFVFLVLCIYVLVVIQCTSPAKVNIESLGPGHEAGGVLGNFAVCVA